jgi:hypothetical protein
VGDRQLGWEHRPAQVMRRSRSSSSAARHASSSSSSSSAGSRASRCRRGISSGSEPSSTIHSKHSWRQLQCSRRYSQGHLSMILHTPHSLTTLPCFVVSRFTTTLATPSPSPLNSFQPPPPLHTHTHTTGAQAVSHSPQGYRQGPRQVDPSGHHHVPVRC